MAKSSVKEREKKREQLIKRYEKKRKEIKQQIIEASTLKQKWQAYEKLSQLPKDSSPVRQRRRCWLTGRSRGVYRYFGLCRHMVRKMAHEGLLAGVTKSSW
jgi:small subunit ribosomal protein S14|uniref:Small ribosomal subunit protein uS14c n=2 Tax=Cyanidioschyzon merolae TaxID=45157 RepID=RR14_CYAM1|nr:ribosomal protein S14 [Cyanidioschyzon merolae strain 10D]Q85FY5.1 RecName: Full=Small ribosomal subunit protein uS14c; AltName: Full=30S ribosomal protein S14, chloroplastic [Cyanidioschyzon merolae strain 10D]QFV16999.1 30S ribosomal protein S14 [Cyanidioschyzon merolae]QFV17175.1 30S ribosomal protein S14 [Cyanidioschyzon merolae]BAC76208.1 30S ribosomal protein S14 [Cyanidioschyzon merolae strain 10D]